MSRLLMVLSWLHVACAESPVSATISTNSVKIAPSRLQSDAIPDLWTASTAYSQGDMAVYGANLAQTADGTITAGTCYMATLADTSSTNAPTHTSGDTLDGATTGVVWRAISTNVKIKPASRIGIEVISLSTNYVYLSVGSAAVAGKGITLTGVGSSWTPIPITQDAIYAISGSTNETVTIQEILK